jgi:hypothetical protein
LLKGPKFTPKDTTKDVDASRQPGCGHGSRNQLRSV